MKLILDVDTGIDDALAIAYALGSEQVDLVGITCCFGNVRVDTAVRNSRSILRLLGRGDVRVYAGENRTFLKNEEFIPSDVCLRVHGQDGIGGILLQGMEEKTTGPEAVSFMAEMAEKYGSDLAIVATAALTNVARFIKKYPKQAKKVGRIAFMGGALTVPGNITPYAEYNILSDPEAARFVLESRILVTMVGLDVTLKTCMSGEEMGRFLKPWKGLGPAGVKFYEMVRYYCNNEVLREEKPKGAIHDPMAVAAVLHPEWFQTIQMNLTAQTEAPLRGRTIGNPERRMERQKSAVVCVDVEESCFMQDFAAAVGRALRP